MRTAALVLSAMMAAGASGAGSSGPSSVESGWWNTSAVGPFTVPSTTPSGQLQVSNGLQGPLAYSAIRFSLPGGTDPSAAITIRLTATGAMIGTPAVSACPTKVGTWKPGDDQAPGGAPGYSCQNGRQAVGAVSGTGESWTIPAGWASKGVVSVALVPSVGTTDPFSVSYVAPTAASVMIAAPSAPPAAGSGAVPAGPPVTSGGPVTAPSGPPVTTGVQSAVGPSGVGVAVGSLPPANVPSPNLGSLPVSPNQSSAPAAVAAPASAPAGSTTTPAPNSRRGARILAFCLLLATGVALFRVAGRPHRPPRSLLAHRYSTGSASESAAVSSAAGSGSPAVVRGIGRFAKVRTAPPTRI